MMNTANEDPFVPGNDNVQVARIGSGYYCKECEAYIKPLIVRVGNFNYPACENCFLNDLKANNKTLGDPIDTGTEVDENEEMVGELDLEDETTEKVTTGE